MDFYRHLFLKRTDGAPITFVLVYTLSILFTFQMLITAYSSSTYMEQFIAPAYIGLLYSVGAAVAIFITLTLPRLLRSIGNVATCLLLVLAINLSLLLIGLALGPVLTIAAFILYTALSPQIYINIDIFLETLTGSAEGTTGTTRGLILTLMSVAAFLSPLAMGQIVGEESNLSHVYYVGAVVGVLLIGIIVARFRSFLDPVYQTIRVRDMIREVSHNKDIKVVMTAQFLLQFFFTWAIIYIPLYLADYVGFDWPTISLILAAGLFAFVLFEYPIGAVADRHIGEKEMMAVGFVILALTMAAASFMAEFALISWMVLMFVSRIGASLVEVTTESYFFKKVTGDQPALISLFRLMRPLANLLGALVGSLSLLFLPFHLIFLVLALAMASGVFITSFLTDTK